MIFNAHVETQRLVRTDRYKLIHYPKIGRNQLFDLRMILRDEGFDRRPEAQAREKKLLSTLRKKRIELGDGLLDFKAGNDLTPALPACCSQRVIPGG